MKIYQLGPDTPYDVPDGSEHSCYYKEDVNEQYFWLVHWYEDIDGYSGQGQAVALGKDGLLYLYDLGHCSCYGAFDCWGMNRTDGMNTEEFLQESDSIHDVYYRHDVDKIVKDKVRTLLK